MQVCLGATYSWSAFVSQIRASTGMGQGAAQVPFTLFYIVFPVTVVAGGMLVGRVSPRVCAMAGGALFGAGWVVASLGGVGFGFTILGVGVLGGIGAGLAYLVPIAVGVLWFPRHKGLVTGIAVAGFAAGAALISAAADRLAPLGWGPFEVIRACGLVFLVVLPLAGAVMHRPPGAAPAASRRAIPVRELLADPAFGLLYFAMFAGLMAGLGVNANVKQLAPQAAATAGLSVVGCFALANAAGRIAHGWLADRVRARTVIAANLLAQAALLFAAPLFLDADSAGAMKTLRRSGGIQLRRSPGALCRHGRAPVGCGTSRRSVRLALLGEHPRIVCAGACGPRVRPVAQFRAAAGGDRGNDAGCGGAGSALAQPQERAGIGSEQGGLARCATYRGRAARLRRMPSGRPWAGWRCREGIPRR